MKLTEKNLADLHERYPNTTIVCYDSSQTAHGQAGVVVEADDGTYWCRDNDLTEKTYRVVRKLCCMDKYGDTIQPHRYLYQGCWARPATLAEIAEYDDVKEVASQEKIDKAQRAVASDDFRFRQT